MAFIYPYFKTGNEAFSAAVSGTLSPTLTALG